MEAAGLGRVSSSRYKVRLFRVEYTIREMVRRGNPLARKRAATLSSKASAGFLSAWPPSGGPAIAGRATPIRAAAVHREAAQKMALHPAALRAEAVHAEAVHATQARWRAGKSRGLRGGNPPRFDPGAFMIHPSFESSIKPPIREPEISWRNP